MPTSTHSDEDPHVDYAEGEWEPRRRYDVPLPWNLPREFLRLIWHLDDVGCTRSPFIIHPDCLEAPFESMCPRCRALRPYREVIPSLVTRREQYLRRHAAEQDVQSLASSARGAS